MSEVNSEIASLKTQGITEILPPKSKQISSVSMLYLLRPFCFLIPPVRMIPCLAQIMWNEQKGLTLNDASLESFLECNWINNSWAREGSSGINLLFSRIKLMDHMCQAADGCDGREIKRSSHNMGGILWPFSFCIHILMNTHSLRLAPRSVSTDMYAVRGWMDRASHLQRKYLAGLLIKSSTE